MRYAITMSIAMATGCIAGVSAWGAGASDRGEPTLILDALRMPCSRQIQKFWQVLEECVKTEPDFKIKEEVRQSPLTGKLHSTTYTYTVSIPEFMQAGLPGLRGSDQEPFLEMLLVQALRKKKTSGYAALLAIHAGYGYLNRPVKHLLTKDKVKRPGGELVSKWLLARRRWEHASVTYSRWLFLRRLSAKHQSALVPDRNSRAHFWHAYKPSLLSYRKLKADRETGLARGFDKELAVGDAITDHATKADTRRLEKLPCDSKTLRIWGSYLLNSRGKDFSMVLGAFLRYAEVQKHAPLYADMALALLVVRGYEYDSAKGRYKLNSVGTQLLEYAIEHPIPKLLPVAKVLKERWDEKAMMKLIQKHYPDVQTSEQFETLMRSTKARGTKSDPRAVDKTKNKTGGL